MLEKVGLVALFVLVAAESFAFSEAVLWAATAFAHLGALAIEMTFALSAVIGLACGAAILRLALRNHA